MVYRGWVKGVDCVEFLKSQFLFCKFCVIYILNII